MQTTEHLIDYENAIVDLVRQLPEERAAQLYDFARFLLAEVGPFHQAVDGEGVDEQLSDEELAAEDALWEASKNRHKDRFAALKAQAKADVKAKKAVPMFNERGEFTVE